MHWYGRWNLDDLVEGVVDDVLVGSEEPIVQKQDQASKSTQEEIEPSIMK